MRWFRRGVTLSLILVCNVVLLGALWLSGLDLDFVLTNSELYDPESGHCVGCGMGRGGRGREDRSGCVRNGWIRPIPTGRVHTLRSGEPLAMSTATGICIMKTPEDADHRALGLLLFAAFRSSTWA